MNQGVALFSVGSSLSSNSNTIVDNTIGLGAGGAPLPNGGDGVLVASGTGNTISGNSISSNGDLGIDLTNGSDAQGVTENDEGDTDTGGNNLRRTSRCSTPLRRRRSPGRSTRPPAIWRKRVPARVLREPKRRGGDPGCDPLDDGEGQVFLGGQDVTIGEGGSEDFTFTFRARRRDR